MIIFIILIVYYAPHILFLHDVTVSTCKYFTLILTIYMYMYAYYMYQVSAGAVLITFIWYLIPSN